MYNSLCREIVYKYYEWVDQFGHTRARLVCLLFLSRVFEILVNLRDPLNTVNMCIHTDSNCKNTRNDERMNKNMHIVRMKHAQYDFYIILQCALVVEYIS